jgi:hypothetical protein
MYCEYTAKALGVQIIIYYKHEGILKIYTKTPPIPNGQIYHIWHHNNDVLLSESDLNHYSPLFTVKIICVFFLIDGFFFGQRHKIEA